MRLSQDFFLGKPSWESKCLNSGIAQIMETIGRPDGPPNGPDGPPNGPDGPPIGFERRPAAARRTPAVEPNQPRDNDKHIIVNLG